MLTKDQKVHVVEQAKLRIEESKSVVFMNYRGLSVADFGALKKELRKEGAELQVVKKRLFERAAKDAGLSVNVKDLDGQLSVAFSLRDEVSAAKIIDTFSKKNDKIQFLGGILEGNQIDANMVKALAKLPGRQELIAQVVGTIKAPLSGFVNVLNGNISGFVRVLKAIGESK